MGVFYAVESTVFIDDMAIDHEVWASRDYDWKYIEDLYYDSALTCFIAMGCYMFTFTLSVIMFFMNRLMK